MHSPVSQADVHPDWRAASGDARLRADQQSAFARFLAERNPGLDLIGAEAVMARTGTTLVDALPAAGLMSEVAAYQAFAEFVGQPFLDLDAHPPNPLAARLIPERVARRHQIVPVSEDNRSIVYATALAWRDEVDRDVAFAAGRRPQMAIVTRTQLVLSLNRAYRQDADIEALIAKFQNPVGELVEADLALGDAGSPIVTLCNHILGAAVAAGASDIHLEPGLRGAVVRHRVCGILEPLIALPLSAVSGVTNRFKIMAQTDIASRHKPQDGAFRVMIDGTPIDVRLSVLPTIHGEKLVMRVIDGGVGAQKMDTLGYPESVLGPLKAALSRPDGLVLVTGPTGSGKTTVLYAALQHLVTGRVNILTVEDPVERRVDGVTQIAVNARAGTGFAGVLRSVMRQDPNIIMVGEIRDAEVADIVGQAAYTGHLVLSSLHTIDAASAITRLLNLGLQPFKVAESLSAVVAQRLLRRLCQHCKIVNDVETAASLGAANGVGAIGASLGPGCPRCRHSGYLDRVPVPEILLPDDALRTAIRNGAGAAAIRAAMANAGGVSMRDYALQLVEEGVTSLDEVNRVLSRTQEVAAPQPARVAPQHPRVLVVDDDLMIRVLVKLLLEKHGYEVLQAPDGLAGLEIAQRERPDLMVVDLQMPNMMGHELVERIRADMTFGAMPLLVLTADKNRNTEQQLLTMGADDYLVKPFDPDVLAARVAAAFRRARRVVG